MNEYSKRETDRIATMFDQDAKAAAVAHAAGVKAHNVVTTGMAFHAGVEWAVSRLPALLRQADNIADAERDAKKEVSGVDKS